ncbi:hypothetical protein CHS0354_008899 [Potamilus streckersoni]|uniref:Uncharacterized protein n=1 Tax=Potamilus streckersoni TaxID=2493646 RepID=A0AAE0W3E4_9BIVA|nr:hypothetical protein CHS0354_008899 [Potamilus streckersoni]
MTKTSGHCTRNVLIKAGFPINSILDSCSNKDPVSFVLKNTFIQKLSCVEKKTPRLLWQVFSRVYPQLGSQILNYSLPDQYRSYPGLIFRPIAFLTCPLPPRS